MLEKLRTNPIQVKEQKNTKTPKLITKANQNQHISC